MITGLYIFFFLILRRLHYSDIDNTLENMSTYKKNKWITESKLRRSDCCVSPSTDKRIPILFAL